MNTGLFNYSITDLAVMDSSLFVATRGAGIFRSTNGGLQWVSTAAGLWDMEVYTLLATASVLFAGTGGGPQAGVYASTDYGLTWAKKSTGLSTPAHVKTLASKEEFIFAGVYGSGQDAGVFVSSNQGNSWTQASTGITNTYVTKIAVVGRTLLAGIDNGGGVFASTDNGATWAPSNLGLSDSIIQSFLTQDSTIFVGTYTGGVSFSGNFGASWTPVNEGLLNMDIKSLAADSLFVYAGSAGGWFGENGVWRRPLADLIAPVPVQLASFVGYALQGGGVILRWRTISEVNNLGFEVQRRYGVSGDFTTIPNSFVPGHGSTLVPQDYSYIDHTAIAGLVYYRLRQIDLDGTIHYSDPIQVDVPTGVSASDKQTGFRLYQNYPNPFNPSTTIKYEIPEAGHVRLALFDMLGREVRVLVDGFQDAGEKRVTLDAEGLASGV